MPVPNTYKRDVMQGVHDHVNDTVQVMLLDSAFTTNIDTQEHVSDINASELSGTGYSRKTLATASVTVDNTDDEGVFDADDVTWSGLDAGTIGGIAIFRDDGGGDTVSDLIVVLDDTDVTELDLATNGSDVTLSFNAEGIVNIG